MGEKVDSLLGKKKNLLNTQCPDMLHKFVLVSGAHHSIKHTALTV